jgi:hypothetical protein
MSSPKWNLPRGLRGPAPREAPSITHEKNPRKRGARPAKPGLRHPDS